MKVSEITKQDMTIEELDELKLVGFRVLCSGDQYIVEIPKASFHLSKRINEVKHIINPLQQFGAFFVENKTPDEDGYWVGVEVKEFEDIPTDMVTITVPPQRYAVARHSGPNYKIMETYDLLHNWIEQNKYTRLKNKWNIEKFYDWKNTEKVNVELFDTIE
ncbi:GyrI-like domain-containing protein [Cytobacillus solani]|uniref:GyrI-like domain-containing protein n=1 Tax=Cytobacillus solani TaxID=1637975 RepID=UPI001FE77B65|nr:GyrI-like domain-containing protein [Cytobacillus solani]